MVPPLKSNDDTLAETDVEKAILLNLTFQKVFRMVSSNLVTQ